MTTTIYDELNNIPEIMLRAGSNKVLTFVCYQEDGVNLLNVTGGSLSWRLCPYGEFSVNVLTIQGVFEDSNTFSVTINPSDTEFLNGKYIQQLIITDFDEHEFIPGQGNVIIFPKIVD